MTVATGETIEQVEARFDGQGYAAFKDAVGDALVELLGPIQARYRELRSDPAELARLLELGAEKARAASAPTLSAMYERMGFARIR
jgi:tryptophanyl-tRNA synthetase